MSDYQQPGYGPNPYTEGQGYGYPSGPGYQQPAPGQQQPAPGHQQPAPGYQQPAPGYQQAVPGQQQATPGYQQTVPGYQQPAPGYQQPVPTPGYDPAAGVGAGYGGQRPPATSTGPAMWSHLGALLTITAGSVMCCGVGAFLGWIFPMTLRNNDRHKHDPYIRHHATQALNFGITQAIMAALGTVLYFASAFIFAAAATESQRNGSGLAVPLLTIVCIMGSYAITGMICAIIATVKATRGELWTYPRLIAWPISKG